MSKLNTRIHSDTGPVSELSAVVPSDTTDLPRGRTRGLFVGGAGTMVISDASGNMVEIHSASSQYHPLRVVRVLASGTTATNIVALYN